MSRTATRDHLAQVAHLWLSDAAPTSDPPAVPVWALLADHLAAEPIETAAALTDFWARQGGRVAILQAGAERCTLWRPASDRTPPAESVVFAAEPLAGRAAVRRSGPAAGRAADLCGELARVNRWANRLLLLVDPRDAEAAHPLLAAAETLLLAIRPAREDRLAAYRTLKSLAAELPEADWAAICLDAATAADAADTVARLRDTAAEHLDLDVTDAGFLLAEPDVPPPALTPVARSDSLAPLRPWLEKKGSRTLFSAHKANADNVLGAGSERRTPFRPWPDDAPAVVPLIADTVTSEGLLGSILAELDFVLPGVRTVNGSARPDGRPIAQLMDADGRGVLLAASADDPIFLLADLAERVIAPPIRGTAAGVERRIVLVHRGLPARTAALIRCLKFDVELLAATLVRLPTGAGILLATSDVYMC